VKSPDQLLRQLERRDVEELALVSGRLPTVKVSGSVERIPGEAPSGDDILSLLMIVGGSRYVDTLGPVPKQWTSRLAGVGILTVSAVVPRDGEVQARFSVAARDDRGQAGSKPDQRPSAPVGRDGRKSVRPPPGRPSGDAARSPGVAPPVLRSPSFGLPLSYDALPPPAPTSAMDRQPRRRSFAFEAPSVPVPTRPRDGAAERERPKPAAPSFVGEPFRPPSGPPDSDDPRRGRPSTKPMGDLAALVQAAAAPVPLAPQSRPAPPPPSPPPPSPPPPPSSPRGPSAAAASARRSSEGLRDLEPLLRTARSSGATDVHVVSGRPLLLRVAGDLKTHGDALAAREVERMLLGCIPDRLTSTFVDLGSCDFSLDLGALGRFRANVSRQQTGLKATIRVVPRDVPTLELLGLPSAIGPAARHHQGLIVVTGPTGHGKTSTLAAIVDILNQSTTSHIITVEDPIEYVHPKKKALVSQREVGTHTRTFASALKGSLREDPDVIVVGELRDTETVRMAVSASETGHLVIGTMNTPSAAKTIDRLIDLFPPADQPQVRTALASGLRLIVGQRLVPSVDRSRMHAAAELLPGSVPLSALIREGKTFQIPSLQQRSKALGIIRMDDSLAALVQERKVTMDVARSYAESPAEMDSLVATRGSKRA
jgi:twitching motility protein PilT